MKIIGNSHEIRLSARLAVGARLTPAFEGRTCRCDSFVTTWIRFDGIILWLWDDLVGTA